MKATSHHREKFGQALVAREVGREQRSEDTSAARRRRVNMT